MGWGLPFFLPYFYLSGVRLLSHRLLWNFCFHGRMIINLTLGGRDHHPAFSPPSFFVDFFYFYLSVLV